MAATKASVATTSIGNWLDFLAYEGLIRLVVFRGRYRGSWSRPDDSALLRLVRRARPVQPLPDPAR